MLALSFWMFGLILAMAADDSKATNADRRLFAGIVTDATNMNPASSTAGQGESKSNVKAPNPTGIVELFEDGAEPLLKLLTNPDDGPGAGEADDKVVFSGKTSLKITQYQRFNRRMPGWDYAIREKPAPGQYRYLRLAWRSGGCETLMLQLHDATDWHIRYTAGPNPYGWMTRFVADKAPKDWNLVTIDLFKDFGERTLTGIAFSIHGGPGYFDHVYLGRTIDDLDRIDTGLASKMVRLEPKDLERLWQELANEDAAKQYRSFWTLVAGGESSSAFIKKNVFPAATAAIEAERIRAWIGKLDAESFATREAATAELRKHLESAESQLEGELAGTPSFEARRRIERLLGERPASDESRLRREQGRRILDFIAARAAATSTR